MTHTEIDLAGECVGLEGFRDAENGLNGCVRSVLELIVGREILHPENRHIVSNCTNAQNQRLNVPEVPGEPVPTYSRT